MSSPLFSRGKTFGKSKCQAKKVRLVKRSSKILFSAILIAFAGLSVRLFSTEPVFFAYASGEAKPVLSPLKSPLFEQKVVFDGEGMNEQPSLKQIITGEEASATAASNELKQKIYDIVGDAPIREMVPFISQRDKMVAAFLVGIAKKESSFGFASPSKNGETCYNYWGYKGEGGRGTGMGYACFASAEEAIQVVGDRIEVLVEKDRNTPALMVNTWKCGTSCVGDPGAPSWISTVALYFEKIVG